MESVPAYPGKWATVISITLAPGHCQAQLRCLLRPATKAQMKCGRCRVVPGAVWTMYRPSAEAEANEAASSTSDVRPKPHNSCCSRSEGIRVRWKISPPLIPKATQGPRCSQATGAPLWLAPTPHRQPPSKSMTIDAPSNANLAD